MMGSGQGRHRRVNRFIKEPPKNKKSSFSSRRTRTGNTISCGTTLFAGNSGHLSTVPTHRLPLTQALRQQILWIAPFPPALGGPFAAPLFAPISAPGTLCGCALQFYFRFNGFSMICHLYTKCVRLSSTFFHDARKRLPNPQNGGRMDKIIQISVCGAVWIESLAPSLRGLAPRKR